MAPTAGLFHGRLADRRQAQRAHTARQEPCQGLLLWSGEAGAWRWALESGACRHRLPRTVVQNRSEHSRLRPQTGQHHGGRLPFYGLAAPTGGGNGEFATIHVGARSDGGRRSGRGRAAYLNTGDTLERDDGGTHVTVLKAQCARLDEDLFRQRREHQPHVQLVAQLVNDTQILE